jgi:carboxyl-terminal processing protease
MLAGLDPHSGYMNPHSFRDMQVQTRGEFGGLGIEVTMEDGLIKVVAPIDDTPAAKAGVMANDIITQVDDSAVQGLTIDQAVDKMRGPVNTKINLTIVRKGSATKRNALRAGARENIALHILIGLDYRPLQRSDTPPN